MADALLVLPLVFGPETVVYDPPAPPPPVVAIYGDSYTGNGYGGNSYWGWPAIVGRKVGAEIVNQARGGTGYVAPAGGPSFAYSAMLLPVPTADVVVVFGSPNDWQIDPEMTRQNAVITFTAVRMHSPDAALLVIGPQWPNGSPDDRMWANRDAVRSAAAQCGATFVDPLAGGWFAGRPDLIGPDGWHPTWEGQRHLADLIAPHIAALLGN